MTGRPMPIVYGTRRVSAVLMPKPPRWRALVWLLLVGAGWAAFWLVLG